jgi:hypothetical protein
MLRVVEAAAPYFAGIRDHRQELDVGQSKITVPTFDRRSDRAQILAREKAFEIGIFAAENRPKIDNPIAGKRAERRDPESFKTQQFHLERSL